MKLIEGQDMQYDKLVFQRKTKTLSFLIHADNSIEKNVWNDIPQSEMVGHFGDGKRNQD